MPPSAMRPVLQWPDKRLRTPAESVPEITDHVRAIWDEMVAVMEAMPGVGLAAVQLGEMQRLAVVDASQDRGRVIRMANPELLHVSPETNDHEEASPCLPGVFARITRPKTVIVRFLTEKGAWKEQEFVDLWATSVQHQIDHLNGKMYFDHLSKMKRDMLLKRARKLR